LTNGATIDSSTFNAGAGGTVAVTATERFAIGGQDSEGFGSAMLSGTAGRGNAGEIVITAPIIEFTDGGVISTNTGAAGNAGAILLTTGQLTMTGDARITSRATDTSTGASGNITITADESARLTGGALITATSAGPGNAGSITIDGGTLIRGIDSTITGEAQQASGGNVTLIAEDLIHLTRTNVTASVQGGPQSIGGNILFDPQIILLQNSQIVARATQGAGGTITLVAGTVLADPSSLISASSQSGPQGTVTIQSPLQNLSGALVPLQQGFLPVTTLHAERCAARMSEGKVSTFVVTLREGLPPEPGGPLPSPLEDDLVATPSTATGPILLASGTLPRSPAPVSERDSTGWSHQACRR
jgi:hypothetical protein